MTRLLQVLLMVLTIGLCGACIVQWKREFEFRNTIQEIDALWKGALETIDQKEDQLAAWEKEISRLNALVDEKSKALEEKIQELKNADMVAQAQEKADARVEMLQKVIEEAKASIETQNEQIKTLNLVVTEKTEQIQSLTEQLKTLVEQRDDFANKLNSRTKELNEVTEKYNKLLNP